MHAKSILIFVCSVEGILRSETMAFVIQNVTFWLILANVCILVYTQDFRTVILCSFEYHRGIGMLFALSIYVATYRKHQNSKMLAVKPSH